MSPRSARTADRHANKLRIIGGRWRGRRVGFPSVPGLRPTPDRVRETLFNWLGQDLAGAKTLDLFAGSGALTLEALSRGAALGVAVDRHAGVVAQARCQRSGARHDGARNPLRGCGQLSRARDEIVRRYLSRSAVRRRGLGGAHARLSQHGSHRLEWCTSKRRRRLPRREGWKSGEATRPGGYTIICCAAPMIRTPPRLTPDAHSRLSRNVRPHHARA